MAEALEGHVHIDMTKALLELPVGKVIAIANLAMNRLTIRDWGEIGHGVGVEFDLGFVDKR